MSLNRISGRQLKDAIAGNGIGVDAQGNLTVLVDDGLEIVDDKVTIKSDYVNYNSFTIDKVRGFIDRSEVTISLTGIDKDTLVLAPTGSSFRYILDGKLVTVNGNVSITLPDIGGGAHANGIHFIYFDDTSGTLKTSQTPWDILSVSPVAIILWYQGNAQGLRSLLGNELHSTMWPSSVHKHLHYTYGTKKLNGGTISGYTLQTATNSAITYSISQAQIADEDIIIDIPALVDGNGTGANYTIIHRDASGINKFKQGSNVPFPVGPNGIIQKDSTTGLIECTSGKYINSYVLLTNFQGEARHVVIMGTLEFDSQASAYSETLSSLGLTLPITEFVSIYRITWYVNSSYSNTGKCRIEGIHDFVTSQTDLIASAAQFVLTANPAPIPGYVIGTRLSFVDTNTVEAQSGIIEIGGYAFQNDTSIVVPWNTSENGVTKQSNTWYYVYVKQNPENPTAWIPFISTVLPTKNQFGETIPSDSNSPKYHPTLKARYIGSFRTNSSNQIMNFTIIGNYVAYIGQGYNYIIQSGTASNKTAVNCRRLVPYTSRLAQVYYELGSGGNTRYIGDSSSWYFKSISGAGALIIPVTNNSIYYECDGNTISLGIHGYHEII